MTFSPTPEQQLCIEAAQGTKDNLLISALAGAAKTSTLILIAKALISTPILSLAFNKKIADEMRERLPGNCVSSTLNSLGHRAWADFVGGRLTIDTKKSYNSLQHHISKLQGEEKTEAFELFSETLKAIGFGKACGYIPSKAFPQAKALMGDDDFFAHLDEEPTPLQERLIRAVSIDSINEGFNRTVDFDDQILLSTVFPASFPKYPLTMVDEAQDLSALNHVMLNKITRGTTAQRVIAVGDECQAIYGFRGAHQNSMDLLEQSFSMKRLLLSVSFRCPIAVVREAHWRAPHMRYPEWAIEGTVTHKAEWTLAEIPDNAVILCRNNAPLFRLAITMLRHGRYPQLIGNDIGKYLLKILKDFGPSTMLQEDVLAAIESWRKEKLAKTRTVGSINDRAACLQVFAEAGPTLSAAIGYAESIFQSQGPIRLMTGHKSKGLEFPNVFILDRHLLRLEDENQDRNLLYVMQTRAKETLTYIDSDSLVV